MPASPQTIWQMPAYLPGIQPPLTDSIVRDAERALGVTLPGEYLALLRVQNGGYIRYGLPKTPHSTITGIGPFLPTLTDFSWDYAREQVSFELDGLVPFDGDGHWLLCLDYRSCSLRSTGQLAKELVQTGPRVTYIDIESDSESIVASSFAEYLSMLRLKVSDEEYVFVPTADLAGAVRALGASLGVNFGEPDTWAHGYPLYCASLGLADDPEYLWVHPNRVPKGYAREEDARFTELQNSSRGDALLYEDLPSQALLLQATDGAKQWLLTAARAAGLELRPLTELVRD
jgi:SMI1 / KNR4 family (SUKH-1)